jgi:hypothetical protein
MSQNLLVVAAHFFQNVGQARNQVKGSVGINRLCQFNHGKRQPGRIEGQRSEGYWAKDVSEQDCLGKKFGSLRADQGIGGNPDLGASRSISGGYGGVGGSGVPSGMASGPLTGKPGRTQRLRACKPISEILCCFNRSTTKGIYPRPETPRTCDSEQAQFPVAGLAP